MSTLKVNTIQTNTGSGVDIDSPLDSINVTNSATIGGNLQVNNILPSVGTNVAIGTAGGSVTLTGSVTGSSIINTGVTTVSAGSTSAPSISPTGDSNTGIFFPSADTIAFAEGGVESLRVDSSGNLGINSTSPARKLDVVDSGASGSVIRSRVTTNNGGYLAYEALNSSGTSVFNVTHNGRINLSENIVFASGQGLDFSATANSSGTMTSELLSDYEEGSWTPTLLTGGTVSTILQATYTRIGRLVTVYFYINLSSIPNNSSQFQIGGLPYTAIGGAHYSTGQIGYCGSFNLGPWRPLVTTGGIYIYFHRIDGSNPTLLNSGATGLGELLISLWYYAA